MLGRVDHLLAENPAGVRHADMVEVAVRVMGESDAPSRSGGRRQQRRGRPAVQVDGHLDFFPAQFRNFPEEGSQSGPPPGIPRKGPGIDNDPIYVGAGFQELREARFDQDADLEIGPSSHEQR